MNKTEKILKHRYGLILIAIAFLCSISLITRIVLLFSAASNFDWNVLNVLKVFLLGTFFDLAAASYAIIPLVIYLWLMPQKWFAKRWNKVLLFIYFFIVILTLLFNAISEWFFWQEFSVRYNFIAVDYLVYTTEVIGNIRQSYPINTIMALLLLTSGLIVFFTRKPLMACASSVERFKQRTKYALPILLVPVCIYFFVNHDWKETSENQFVNELSGNGMYDFGYAFWHNQLDYDKFYKTLPVAEAFKLASRSSGFELQNTNVFSRKIVAPKVEIKRNVVLISVESLSAEFLESFGNTQHLTPNLDSLAHKGILFTNLYASGTRTVRGLEALSLAIPPTPGQSIVKRPDNRNLFTLGNVFKSKGYHSRFIYGGYGYFDNMNEFFSQNGYDVTDRGALKDNEIHYANVWGVADEDLFTLSLRELDIDYRKKTPFFAHIMTVSNHRPYTYPEGRIDIPSHTSREGAVKYTDYAIGKFMKEAENKPWFSNTLFVIVADHCASSAGKVELPVDKYHIPMIIYALKFVNPSSFDKLTAQIDIAPTILGLLNFNYNSKFFGQDVFKINDSQRRAFVSTYQSLGYIKHNQLVILDPNRKVSTFKPDFKSGVNTKVANQNRLTNEAVANYQTAACLYKNKKYQF